jgi:hypothetical protein
MKKERYMKVLEKDNEGCYFIIKSKKVKPENLSKDDLLGLFNDIYILEDINSLEIPNDTEIGEIKDLVEKEIVTQIIQKIQEFKNNLKNMKNEIESSFPDIQAE